ncbi:MAG: permease-like cell division protein FtsX [Candidatus Paraprevotella stercoravium]|jgi:cell division transport system permease protein|uniref:Cell division protein FtsX n=2 Tax=Bacteroidales TaxID=171549 RepID=A0ABT7U2F2_9BACE|nr:permease-like cell division protein FtsX [Candidatus Paraprevotella stercoravium]MDM8144703.1 permease-like cell division protein FtsX [Bacteroides eggerthii]
MRKGKRKRSLTGMQVFTSCISTALVLILFGLVVFFVQVAHELSNSVKEDLVVSVLLSDEAGEDAIQAYTLEMQQKQYIKKLDYISKEQALKEHIQEMGTDPEEFLGSNPFSPSLEIHLKADYANSDSLSWITRDIKAQPVVLNVVYQKDLIDSLNNNLQKVSLVLLILAALLTFVSFGLINSTVKMSLYANRFLIHTMKLVGARWSFIRRPFLSRSFWIGLTSAILANGVLVTGIHLFLRYDPVLENIITLNMVLIMGGAVLLAGILLTLTSSYLSVNKFLRMKAGELHEM